MQKSNSAQQPRCLAMCASFATEKGEPATAQLVVSWFICDGRFRVHAVNAVGRRSGRIIEIEDIDTGERVHGSTRRLERLAQALRSSPSKLDQVVLTPDTTS
jgi:hypothetical protein